jgi:hypothetical protein
MSPGQQQEAVFLDALSIPSPGEVFAAMNRACRPNWATLVTPATAPVTTDRTQLALAVGVLSANGYIAIEAQDGQQVKNVGREIMNVAKALGVSQSLLGRGNSLIEFADNNAWDALAEELEATENEVKLTMVEQKDRDLVTLTSAAAWLRGLEIASGVVLATESLQGIEVIRQPELASKLAAQLGALPPRLKGGAQVALTREALESVASLLKANGLSQQESRNALQKIHDDCSVVVKSILTSATASGTPAPASAPSASSAPSPAPSPAPKATGTNSSASVTK